MKNLLVLSVVMAAFVMLPSKMWAQSASASATGSATILTPITLTKKTNLNFGSMTSSASSGTCVLSTDGTRSATGGVTLLATAPVAANASFSVGGAAGATYTITLPETIAVTAGTNSMTIDTWTAKAASGTTATIADSGTDTFTLGGTLNVDANQAAGTYTGNFSVSVAYN